MADSATGEKAKQTEAETLLVADAVKAYAAEAAKVEPARTAPAKAAPVKVAKAEAPAAAKPVAVKAPEPVKAAAPLQATKPKAVTPVREAPVPVAAKPAKKAAPAKLPAPALKTKTKTIKAKQAVPAATKIAKPAKAGVKAIKTGVTIMTTQNNKAAFAAAEQIKTVVTEANERAKTAMEKSAKIIEELAELGRGNVEAMVASSKVAAKGVESFSQDAANYSRKSFEDATAAFKSFTDVKSATDFFKLQGDFARSAFDSAVAESARVSETMLKLAGDVAEPLTSRYAVAAERVKTLAA